MRSDPGAILRFYEFALDFDRGLLLKNGTAVNLRRKAFELLLHLAKRAGRVVAKTELMDAVWPDVNVTEDSLTQAIREIRKALDKAGPSVIRTVAGRGYFFDPGHPVSSNDAPGGD